MARITYHNVGIKAISACVPKGKVYNKDLGYLIPPNEIKKTLESIGVEERRIADDDVCASDLCVKAAKQLLEECEISPESIDVLLFMSQTGDFRIPATAPLLQHRLGLPKTTACMDLSLACSGYVYALSAAFAYASMEGVNKVLLLDGETFSKIVSRNDKVDWPLYGDGATATLIEKGDYGDSVFDLNSDGSGENYVKIECGMRNPITEETLKEKMNSDGCMVNGLQIHMDGMAVFNFAMKVVPKGVKEMLEFLGKTNDDIDYLVFHQANKFMTDFFIKKLKFDPAKVPYCIQKFGNTSSTSVPLTIVSELCGKLDEEKSVILSGFGAGLSWGTVFLKLKDCNVLPLQEY